MGMHSTNRDKGPSIESKGYIYGVGALYSSLDTKLISSGGPWRAFFTFWNSLFSLGPGVEENISHQEKNILMGLQLLCLKKIN